MTYILHTTTWKKIKKKERKKSALGAGIDGRTKEKANGIYHALVVVVTYRYGVEGVTVIRIPQENEELITLLAKKYPGKSKADIYEMIILNKYFSRANGTEKEVLVSLQLDQLRRDIITRMTPILSDPVDFETNIIPLLMTVMRKAVRTGNMTDVESALIHAVEMME